MRVAPKGVVAVLAFLAGLSIVVFLANSNASAVNHGTLVNDEARRDLPVVLDGDVLAHAQVGNRIFVGGDFQQVQRPDGSTITQPYVFAYDINTGLLDEHFRPVVNGTVNDLAASPNQDALYAGGRFTNWDGDWVGRLAKLSPEGVNDAQFDGKANALVRSLAVTNDTVYMAGNFVTVNDVNSRIGFAAVDRFSGAIDTGFVMNVENSVLSNQFGRGIVANTAGTLVYGLHFGRQINGVDREAVVKYNTNNNSLANWEIDWAGQAGNRECLDDLRDIAISPNDAYIVIGGQGADNAPNCDSVLRYETSGTGIIGYTWSARMYSSVFSLAVSDVAVYVGGHFCAAPLNGAPAGGMTHDPDTGPSGTANSCNTGDPNDSVNPSVIFPTEAVFRNQMAALNPANGQALNWDPGSNNQLAVHDLTIIDRGLLAGHDNTRFSNFLVGRSGFFDFGVPADTTAPTLDLAAPTDGVVYDSLASISGTAGDDQMVSSVVVRLQNLDTNQWLGVNGAFVDTQANAAVSLTNTGLGTYDWNVNLPTLASGEYQITAFAWDPVWNKSTESVITFRIAGTEGCTVALDGNDNPVITYDQFFNVANVQIRRNGTWLSGAAAGSGTYTDTDVTPGSTYNYAVRWKPEGSNVDVACTPTSITVPTGAVDTTPPVITLTSARTQTPAVTSLGGDVTDDISGVDRGRILLRNIQTGEYWNGTSWQTSWVWVTPAITGKTWAVPNVDLTDEGSYQVRMYAWDNDNNRAITGGTDPNNQITVEAAPGNDTTPPVITLSTSNLATGARTVQGSVTDDNSGVDRARILLRNIATGEYWNGTTWQAGWVWVTPTITGNSWALSNVNFSQVGEYQVRMYAWDNENNRAITGGTDPNNRITVTAGGGGQTCTATTNANGSVALSWTAIAGEDSYFVRRNNGWIATTSNLSYTDTSAQAGGTYVIRSDMAGVRTDTACN